MISILLMLSSCRHIQDMSKGAGLSVNEKTNINYDRFNDVLSGKIVKDEVVNKAFRVINNEVVTCEQKKVGLSITYDKRVVLADGISTVPLDI